MILSGRQPAIIDLDHTHRGEKSITIEQNALITCSQVVVLIKNLLLSSWLAHSLTARTSDFFKHGGLYDHTEGYTANICRLLGLSLSAV